MKLDKIIFEEEHNTYLKLHNFIWATHKISSSNLNNKMTKRFLNNYSFAKNDLIDWAYIVPISNIKINDIIQPKSVKSKLESIIEEYKNKELLESFGLKPNNKLIFNWPSWTWKTLYAMAIANHLKKKLYIINLSSIISNSLWKTSSNIFDIIEKCSFDNWIIFFDEFDALAKIRNDDNDHWELKRVASSLIQILDFINDELIFIAATNHIDLIDKAIIRRFSKRIDFELPTKIYIKKYILKLVKDLNMTIDNKVVLDLSARFIWKSYAEIKEELTYKIKKIIIEHSKNWIFNWNIDIKILKY